MRGGRSGGRDRRRLRITGGRSTLSQEIRCTCYGLSRAYAAQHAFLLQTLALNWALVGDPENAEWLKERAALP